MLRHRFADFYVLLCLSLSALAIAGCDQTHGLSADAEGANADVRAIDSELRLFGSNVDLSETRSRIAELRSRYFQRWLRLICTHRDGSYNCACDDFYNPDDVDCGGGSEEPVDECAAGTDDCSENATC